MIVKWALLVLLLQAIVLAVNLRHWFRRRLLLGERDLPLALSVLVPVRNERERLPLLVQMLRRLKPYPLEVILCDDGSDDGSRDWLQQNLQPQGEGERLWWFTAPPKPEGWVGKNWACYQLAQRARGDWLVFVDADMAMHERSVQALADYLYQTSRCQDDCQVRLVTAIPSLEPSSLLVGLLKSMVPFSVFTLLPLPFAEDHPHPAFAFANGQVIAFPRDYYQRFQPHQQVRDKILEDVHLARLVKREGDKVRILDARRMFRVQMYRSFAEAVDGFSKNGVAICGAWWGAIAISAALACVYLAPLAEALFAGATGWHLLHYLLSSSLFAISGWMAGLPWWYGFWFPLSVAMGEAVLWRSIVWYLRGEVRWKGRAYRV